MTEARFIIGDTRDVIATMPDSSVDLIMTSPPFLALRSYLPADHPDKDSEIGSEATPAAFIDVMLGLATEWGRLLTPYGSICIELGDTYSGARGYGKEGTNPMYGDRADERLREAKVKRRFKKADDGWPLAKSLTMIPELFRVGLAYGINPLTGAESPAGCWRVRNVVRWHRPNPPVGALGDKYRPSTSDLVIACKAKDRWFDLDAVRGPGSTNTHKRTAASVDCRPNTTKQSPDGNRSTLPITDGPAGAPPQDTWTIPTAPYKGSHYATYPPELCRIPIQSMCPRHVCNVCGLPRRRIVNVNYKEHGNVAAQQAEDKASADYDGQQRNENAQGMAHGRATKVVETVGWSDCGHDNYRAGIVFDPFAGTGTTLMVATGNGRDAIGIDIDARNADLAAQRVGMFLTVTNHLKDTLDD